MKRRLYLTAVLAASIAIFAPACNKKKEKPRRKVYVRADKTGAYDEHYHGSGFIGFHPLITPIGGGGYRTSGYHSPNLSSHANYGSNASKSNLSSRGGFGSSGRSFGGSSS